MQVEPRAAWCPRGTQPSAKFFGQREVVCAGRNIETGDRFFAQFEAYVSADHAKRFVLVPCDGLQEDAIVVLNGPPYGRVSPSRI